MNLEKYKLAVPARLLQELFDYAVRRWPWQEKGGWMNLHRLHGSVAEHRPYKPGVVGSIPTGAKNERVKGTK